jgi:hypothetical protein
MSKFSIASKRDTISKRLAAATFLEAYECEEPLFPGFVIVWGRYLGADDTTFWKAFLALRSDRTHAKAVAYAQHGSSAIVIELLCRCPEHQDALKRFADHIGDLATSWCAEGAS